VAEPGFVGVVVESGMVAEEVVGTGRRQGEDWGYEEGVDEMAPDGQGPLNAFVNY
jgi:hypothetical protein